MKIKLLFLILVLGTTYSYSQIKFEKGYLIDNENHRIECLIKNYDWKNNPVEFDYKLSVQDVLQKGNSFNVREFGIIGISKFIRVDTKIDRSSEELTTLSTQRNPDWSEERLFLKVLIEGKASLYQYRERNCERYFYSVSNLPIQQLIYKEYLVNNKSIASNNDFRKQLWNDVRGSNTTFLSLETMEFTKAEIESYFKQFNNVGMETSVTYNNNKNREFFLLRVTPGINYSSINVIQSIYGPVLTASDQKLNFRIGVEADFVLPFNKNKWVIIFDPSYQYFNSTFKNNSYKTDINYKSVEFPIGLRYNFYLKDNLIIFLNAFYITSLSFDFNSSVDITFGNSKTHLNIEQGNSYAIGGGVDYGRLSLELRYYSKCDLVNHYFNSTVNYKQFSFILGYTIFKLNRK